MGPLYDVCVIQGTLTGADISKEPLISRKGGRVD